MHIASKGKNIDIGIQLYIIYTMLKKNNTNYPIQLKARIEKVYADYKKIETPFLMWHQFLIREMFQDPVFGIGEKDNPKGLLIDHGVGTGKTITAASV